MSARLWDRLFPGRSALVGMVHLEPLPGAPRWSGAMADVLARARADARALQEAGFDAVVVENYGDVPFHSRRVPAATVSAMTRAVAEVRSEIELPVGVNVLRNDVASALAVAAVTDAAFVRANVHVGAMWTDQGLVEGRADETVRLRASLDAQVAILADVHVKHATPPAGSSLAGAAADAWHRGLADALLVTGSATGAGTAQRDVDTVREEVPDAPVLVASGVTAETLAATLETAHGVVVGSAVMHHGRAGAGVDPERARDFVRRVRS